MNQFLPSFCLRNFLYVTKLDNLVIENMNRNLNKSVQYEWIIIITSQVFTSLMAIRLRMVDKTVCNFSIYGHLYSKVDSLSTPTLFFRSQRHLQRISVFILSLFILQNTQFTCSTMNRFIFQLENFFSTLSHSFV